MAADVLMSSRGIPIDSKSTLFIVDAYTRLRDLLASSQDPSDKLTHVGSMQALARLCRGVRAALEHYRQLDSTGTPTDYLAEARWALAQNRTSTAVASLAAGALAGGNEGAAVVVDILGNTHDASATGLLTRCTDEDIAVLASCVPARAFELKPQLAVRLADRLIHSRQATVNDDYVAAALLKTAMNGGIRVALHVDALVAALIKDPLRLAALSSIFRPFDDNPRVLQRVLDQAETRFEPRGPGDWMAWFTAFPPHVLAHLSPEASLRALNAAVAECRRDETSTSDALVACLEQIAFALDSGEQANTAHSGWLEFAQAFPERLAQHVGRALMQVAWIGQSRPSTT
jgi:hypothetical protein